MLEKRKRPAGEDRALTDSLAGDNSTVPLKTSVSLDLDAVARSHNGVLVVQVEVGRNGHTRTFLYRNLESAQRCVERARRRGAAAHVTLAQLVPTGVLVSEAGDR